MNTEINKQTHIGATWDDVEDRHDPPSFQMHVFIDHFDDGPPQATICRNGSSIGFDDLCDPELLRRWGQMLIDAGDELESEIETYWTLKDMDD